MFPTLSSEVQFVNAHWSMLMMLLKLPKLVSERQP